jgi:hypothetical protein
MATVVLAVGLMIVGLALAFFQAQAVDLIRQLPLPNDLTRQIVSYAGERFVAWALLAASPILLIIGSLVKGI